MLKRLHVDNFRCLANFEMSPASVCALVGPNGGGKSTVLEVLRGLQGFLGGKDVKECFPAWNRTRWDQRSAQRFEMDLIEAGSLFSYSLEIQQPSSTGGMPHIADEQLRCEGQLLYRLVDNQVQLFGDDPKPQPRTTFPFTAVRSFLPQLEARPDNQRIMAFRNWLAAMWLFTLTPQNVEPRSDSEAWSLDPTGYNFVSWYRYLVQTPIIEGKIREDLGPIIPGITQIKLDSLSPTAKSLVIECVHGSRTFNLVLNELSDGQRALLILYAIRHAIAPKASLLVFDEPDNFVAHDEIQPWLAAVREAVVEAGRGNLIVASHHPEVIDYLAPDQTLRLWHDTDGPTRILQVEFDRDQGLAASEQLRLGVGNAE